MSRQRVTQVSLYGCRSLQGSRASTGQEGEQPQRHCGPSGATFRSWNWLTQPQNCFSCWKQLHLGMELWPPPMGWNLALQYIFAIDWGEYSFHNKQYKKPIHTTQHIVGVKIARGKASMCFFFSPLCAFLWVVVVVWWRGGVGIVQCVLTSCWSPAQNQALFLII